MNLRIVQLKPNPTGRDRSILGATASQLAGEWIDIRNDRGASVDLGRLTLYHRAYVGLSSEWKWAPVVAGSAAIAGHLQPGNTLRIHAGRVRTVAVIPNADLVGADVHVFSGHDTFTWNNYRADTAALWEPNGERFVDWAEYAPQPPEGVVLG